MAGPIKDILFRLSGDEDDATEALKKVATELEAFSRIRAEAGATVDTGDADSRLEKLTARLDELSLSTANPDIEVDIAAAQADIATVRAELAALPDEVNIDVKIDQDRTITDRIQGIARATSYLGRAVESDAASAPSFFERLGKSGVNLGGFSTQLRTAVPLMGALLGVVGALVGGLGSLAASAAFAAAGLGALAVAGGAALVPALGLGIAAIADFKANATTAGTAAYQLSQSFSDLADKLDISPAVHIAERGLATLTDRLSNLPLQSTIGRSLESFSRQLSKGFQGFGDVVFKPGVLRQIGQTIREAGRALRPLGRVVGDVFRILTNIADAAMPFLREAIRGMANGLHNMVEDTSNIAHLRDVVGVLVKHLQAWFNLLTAISRVFIGFAKAAAPMGLKLVKFFGDAANNLADWANSEDGRERIREFLRRTVPLFKDLATLIGHVVVLLLLLAEAAAPVLDAFVKIADFVAKVLIVVLDWLDQTQHGIKAWGRDWDAVWGAIKRAVAKVVGPIIKQVRDFMRLLGRIWENIKSDAVGTWRDLARSADTIWDGMTGGIRDLWHALGRNLRNLWDGLKTDARAVWGLIQAAIVNPVRAMARLVSRIFGRVAGAFGDLLHSFAVVGGAIAGVFQTVGGTIANIIKWIIDKVNKAIGLLGSLKDKLSDSGFGISTPGISIKHVGPIPVPIPHGFGVSVGGINFPQEGGMFRVPGRGDGDKVPMRFMLEPGEWVGVMNKKAAAWVDAMNEEHPRHHMQRGGSVQLLPGVNMSVGDEPQILRDLGVFSALMRKVVYVISGYRSPAHSVAVGGFANDPHTQGAAADIGLGSGSRDSMFGVAESILNKAGLYRPFYPQSAAEVNHVQLLHGAAGAAGAAVAAVAKMIPKIKVKGRGVASLITQGAADHVRDAANNFISKLQPKVSSSVSLAGIKGPLPSMAAQIAQRAGAGREATLALFEALLAESGMGTSSSNVLQLLPSTAAGVGIGATDAAGQIAGFLTKGWGYVDPQFGDVHGAIAGAGHVSPASRLAQAIQGSAFADGSNYAAQAGSAAALLHKLGVRGFAAGVRNFAGGLMLVGEHGPELLNARGGTNVRDAQHTAAILDRLAHGTGGPLDGLQLIVKGDIYSPYPNPVRAVLGSKEFPVAVQKEITGRSAHARQHARMRNR